MIPLVVIGAGGFGRETLDVIEAINREPSESVIELIGVVDDAPSPLSLARLDARNVPYLGTLTSWLDLDERTQYVIAVGAPTSRAKLATLLAPTGRTAATLVHPRAVVGSQVIVGAGTVVCSGVQLSTNVQLGQHVHVNPGAIIGHDTEISDFTSINPGAIVSGDVIVRAGVLIGAGATVLQGLEIGARSTVGAMACVVRNVAADATVKGVPAH